MNKFKKAFIYSLFRAAGALSLIALVFLTACKNNWDGALYLSTAQPIVLIDSAGRIKEFHEGPAQVEISGKVFYHLILKNSEQMVRVQVPIKLHFKPKKQFYLKGSSIGQYVDLMGERKKVFIQERRKEELRECVAYQGCSSGLIVSQVSSPRSGCRGQQLVRIGYDSFREYYSIQFLEDGKKKLGEFIAELGEKIEITSETPLQECIPYASGME